jgi:hypothetical protein
VRTSNHSLLRNLSPTSPALAKGNRGRVKDFLDQPDTRAEPGLNYNHGRPRDYSR